MLFHQYDFLRVLYYLRDSPHTASGGALKNYCEAIPSRFRLGIHSKRSGSGPHVLLLHPVGLDWTFWQPTIDALIARYSVLAMDLKGHGRSDMPRSNATLLDYASEVHEFLHHEKFAPCTVVGLSFGGMVAQMLAVCFPKVVEKLVICASVSEYAEDLRQTIAERGTVARLYGMQAIAETTLKRWFTERFLSSEEVAAVRLRLLTNDSIGWETAWKAISLLDTTLHLRAISAPTLCISGEYDQSAPPAVMANMARVIPGARHVMIRKSPHMMHIENVGPFIATVKAFLDEPTS
jgi:3-oxoadipate enol-lactonase